MIQQEKCYVGNCDNCGEVFNNGEFSLFLLESDVKDEMANSDWYADGTDPEHKKKHYCPECFKHHPDIDYKIIVDETRKKVETDLFGNKILNK
jgi:hypothetical protein